MTRLGWDLRHLVAPCPLIHGTPVFTHPFHVEVGGRIFLMLHPVVCDQAGVAIAVTLSQSRFHLHRQHSDIPLQLLPQNVDAVVHTLVPFSWIFIVIRPLVWVRVQVRCTEQIIQTVQLVRGRESCKIPPIIFATVLNTHRRLGMLRMRCLEVVLVDTEHPYGPVLRPSSVNFGSGRPFVGRCPIECPINAHHMVAGASSVIS